MNWARTTLKIDENTLKQAKRKALEEDKTLQEIINEALKSYLKSPFTARKVTIQELTAYPIKIKGDITRASIYEDYLDRKFPRKFKK